MSAVSTPDVQNTTPHHPGTQSAVEDLESRLARLENRATDAITSMDVGMRLAQDIRRYIHVVNSFADAQILCPSADLEMYCSDPKEVALCLVHEATACAKGRVNACMGNSVSLADAAAQLRGALWCLNVALRDLKASLASRDP